MWSLFVDKCEEGSEEKEEVSYGKKEDGRGSKYGKKWRRTKGKLMTDQFLLVSAFDHGPCLVQGIQRRQ